MEIYKDLSNPETQEFEKLLNSKLSKIQIEEGKIIDGKINDFVNNILARILKHNLDFFNF